MVEYRNWTIWWWDDNDKKKIEFTKQTNIDEVVRFCEMRGIKKYVVFDSNFQHVVTDGKRVLLGLG
jgi:predicted RNA-binding protein with PIN domain